MLNALTENGYSYVDGKVTRAKKKEQETVEKEGEARYNRNRSLKGKTFPPYGESMSDSNERAIRWTRSKDVEIGDRKIVTYNGDA